MLLTSREVLEFATIEGARVCGLEDRTGSLTPGKKADLVMIRCDDSNTYPVIDPVSTVVHQADTRNVDTVMVDGEFLKRDGKLVERRPAARARARGDGSQLSTRAHGRPTSLGAECNGVSCTLSLNGVAIFASLFAICSLSLDRFV